MKKYSCMIVDDEKLGRELIKTHLGKIEYLELTVECRSAIEALNYLSKNKVDILFLDINMPDLSGIDFLKQLNSKPHTILTTAYSEYALEGYDLDIVDYLLKPITFQRFFKAVSKVLNLLDQKKVSHLTETAHQAKPTFFFVKADYKKVKVSIEGILYIEALQKYIRIYTKNQKIMTLLSLSKVMEHLPEDTFLRIHRSYIVNVNAIQYVEGNMVSIGEEKLPVSKSQREKLASFIRDHNIGE